MKTVDDKALFAVEWDLTATVDGWVFGVFTFLIGDVCVGDPEDTSVDMLGVARWVRDFLSVPRNRFEEGLFAMPAERVYALLAGSVLAGGGDSGAHVEPYENTFARFHLSHLGMSSFDAVTLLLVKDENGAERCIWQIGSGPVSDACFPPSTLESVLAEFLHAFEMRCPNPTRTGA
ncbi:Imm42 family immunity protein [Pseudoduganella lutea]|nr:Imm42 family immunity protein [Pseudoduganella lutea]